MPCCALEGTEQHLNREDRKLWSCPCLHTCDGVSCLGKFRTRKKMRANVRELMDGREMEMVLAQMSPKEDRILPMREPMATGDVIPRAVAI